MNRRINHTASSVAASSACAVVILTALVIMLPALLSSCVRAEIHDLRTNYRVEYDIDTAVLYNPVGEIDMMWLRFYDVNTGKRVFETWAHPEGTDFTVRPGRYTVVAYSYRNAATKFTFPEDYSLLTAETNATTTSSGSKVVVAPSKFVYGQIAQCGIPFVSDDDPEYVITVPMSSPLEEWRVIVTGMTGLGNNRGITFYLTHQRADILLGSMKREGDVILQFSGKPDAQLKNVDVTFNTFGMVPGESYLLQMQVSDAAGLTYTHTEDVTDQIMDLFNDEHIITFNWEIALLQMMEGGVEPSAKEWEQNYEHHTFQ